MLASWCMQTVEFGTSVLVVIVVFVTRLSFSFSPKGGGQNEIVWIIGGGKYVSVCKACGKLEGSGDMLPREILILDLLLGAFGEIWDCFRTNIIYHLLCH